MATDNRVKQLQWRAMHAPTKESRQAAVKELAEILERRADLRRMSDR